MTVISENARRDKAAKEKELKNKAKDEAARKAKEAKEKRFKRVKRILSGNLTEQERAQLRQAKTQKPMNSGFSEREFLVNQNKIRKSKGLEYQIMEDQLQSKRDIGVSQGFTPKDFRDEKRHYEKIAREEKKFGGDISKETAENLEFFSTMSGERLSPEFLSIGQIKKIILDKNTPRETREAFKRILERRESAIDQRKP